MRAVIAVGDILLDQLPLSGIHVVIDDRVRGDRRGVGEAQDVRLELGICLQLHAVSWLGELDVTHVGHGLERGNTDLTQAAPALIEDQVIFKGVHVIDQHILAVWDNLLPMFTLWRLHADPHQLEIFRLVVGNDIKITVVMGGKVLHAVSTRRE